MRRAMTRSKAKREIGEACHRPHAAVTLTLCLLSLPAVALLSGCAPQRPVLYPNATYQSNGEAVAQSDVDECMQRAKASGVGSNAAANVAGTTAKSAAVGAAAGAAAGAVRGHAGRGAATGAAGAAAGGFMAGLFRSRQLDPIERNFVSRCLAEKGYSVIGWR
jgi:outer membrane lipoprotein SlyB